MKQRNTINVLLTAFFAMVFVLGAGLSVNAQTVFFSENIDAGTSTTNQSIAATTFQNAAPITFSGTADTRTSTSSNGYTGASGERNVFFTSTVGRDFLISGINSSNYENITLQLGHHKSTTAGNNELIIEVSSNGTDWTALSYSRPTGTGTANWTLISPTGTIPSTENLRLRFTQNSSTTQFRIDDISLSGDLATSDPVVISSDASLSGFQYAVGSGPSNDRSFNVSGENLTGNISITPPSNFEISLGTGESFTPTNPITLTPSSGSVSATPVYVRLSSGLSDGSYTGDIEISSSGASNVSVNLNGTVFPTFAIPYSNNLRTQEDFDRATAQGLVFEDAELNTAAGGRIQISPNGYVQTPIIDFTAFRGLSVKFDVRNFNAGFEHDISVFASSNGGENFTLVESVIFQTGTAASDDQTVNVIIDLTGDLNSENGVIRFQKVGGENSLRFRDLTISEAYIAKITGQQGYRLLSSPVATTWQNFLSPIWTQGMTGSDFPGTESTPANVYTWNNAATTDDASNWAPLANLGTTISAGSAALVYVFQDDVFGEAGNFPKTLSVSGTQNELPVNPAINPNTGGLTLVGNPIASVISWGSLVKNGLSGVVYTWDVNDDEGTADPSGNNPVNSGTWISYNGETGSLTDGRIHPFQGFFVQTTGNEPSLSIAQGAESSGGQFYGKEQEPWHVRLVATGQNGSASTWLSFADHHELGKDNFDALQFHPLSSNFTTLATLIGEELIDINSLPVDIQQEIRIPLVLESSHAGSFSFSVNELNLPGDLVVLLEDVESGERLEITRDFTFETTIRTAAKSPASAKELIARGDLRAFASPSDAKFALIVGPRSVTSIDAIASDLPTELVLSQNYPNPFNPTSRIDYQLPEASHVRLSVFDLLGREVAVLVNESMNAGSHFVNVDASNLSSGVYVYRLQAGGQVITRKMTLVK